MAFQVAQRCPWRGNSQCARLFGVVYREGDPVASELCHVPNSHRAGGLCFRLHPDSGPSPYLPTGRLVHYPGESVSLLCGWRRLDFYFYVGCFVIVGGGCGEGDSRVDGHFSSSLSWLSGFLLLPYVCNFFLCATSLDALHV